MATEAQKQRLFYELEQAAQAMSDGFQFIVSAVDEQGTFGYVSNMESEEEVLDLLEAVSGQVKYEITH